MQERDSQFCQREFRAESRRLFVSIRSGQENYSTWLSLDFRDTRLVDTQISETL